MLALVGRALFAIMNIKRQKAVAYRELNFREAFIRDGAFIRRNTVFKVVVIAIPISRLCALQLTICLF